MLDADATNSLALNGLKKVAEAQTAQAREAINAGNADLANQRIAELAQLSPNHPAIAELRAALAKMHETDVQALDQQLAKAEAQLRAGKIDGPEGAQALFLAAIKRALPMHAPRPDCAVCPGVRDPGHAASTTTTMRQRKNCCARPRRLRRSWPT